MAMTVHCFIVFLLSLALFFNLAASQSPATTKGYTNHTVGGSSGWFFNITTNKASSDYSAWAAKQTFNLGDYLIFSTNTNQTVIQTYNETTYKNCTMDDASDDTFQYAGGNSNFGEAMTIAVPLTIEGPQYYFSDAADGVQCLNGLAFEIKVGHGLGLPPSLNQPPPPPYVEPPSTVEAETPPITVVPDRPNDGVRSSTSLFLVVPGLVMLVLLLV